MLFFAWLRRRLRRCDAELVHHRPEIRDPLDEKASAGLSINPICLPAGFVVLCSRGDGQCEHCPRLEALRKAAGNAIAENLPRIERGYMVVPWDCKTRIDQHDWYKTVVYHSDGRVRVPRRITLCLRIGQRDDLQPEAFPAAAQNEREVEEPQQQAGQGDQQRGVVS